MTNLCLDCRENPEANIGDICEECLSETSDASDDRDVLANGWLFGKGFVMVQYNGEVQCYWEDGELNAKIIGHYESAQDVADEWVREMTAEHNRQIRTEQTHYHYRIDQLRLKIEDTIQDLMEGGFEAQMHNDPEALTYFSNRINVLEYRLEKLKALWNKLNQNLQPQLVLN